MRFKRLTNVKFGKIPKLCIMVLILQVFIPHPTEPAYCSPNCIFQPMPPALLPSENLRLMGREVRVTLELWKQKRNQLLNIGFRYCKTGFVMGTPKQLYVSVLQIQPLEGEKQNLTAISLTHGKD